MVDVSAARKLARKNGVVLVDYDPAWPELYEQAAAAIREASGDTVTQIEHVGSTAIPGIKAKPYLDIMPGFATFEDGFKVIPAMDSLGYESRGEYGIPGRHYFSKWIEGDARVAMSIPTRLATSSGCGTSSFATPWAPTPACATSTRG